MRFMMTLSLSVLLAVTTFAQPSEPKAKEVRRPVVAIVGASVSAGYESTFKDGRLVMGLNVREDLSLKKAVESFWSPADVQVESYANALLFLNPESSAKRQSRLARKLKPDLVLAVDFPFWFAYGNNQRYATDAAAKARFSKGLEFLADFECPVIVGDVPLFADADPRMLPPHAVPLPSTLGMLNEVLREWSSSRDNVRLFGLTEWIRAIKETGAKVTVEGNSVPLGADVLFQKDRLHATELGVGLLCTRLHGEVRRVFPREARLCPKDIDYVDVVAHLNGTKLLRAAVKPVEAGK